MHRGTLKVYLCPHSLTSRTCASFSSRVGRVVPTKWTTLLSCKGRVAHAFSAAVICSRHQKTLAASPGVHVRGDTHRRQYALQLPGHGQTAGRLRVAPSGRGVIKEEGDERRGCKTLEARTTAMLTAQNGALFATIRARAQHFHFGPLPCAPCLRPFRLGNAGQKVNRRRPSKQL